MTRITAIKGVRVKRPIPNLKGGIDWKQYCDEVATPLVLADVGMRWSVWPADPHEGGGISASRPCCSALQCSVAQHSIHVEKLNDAVQ